MSGRKSSNQSDSFLSKPAVQSILAALLCIVIGLLIGYIALLIISPKGATEAIITILNVIIGFFYQIHRRNNLFHPIRISFSGLEYLSALLTVTFVRYGELLATLCAA